MPDDEWINGGRKMIAEELALSVVCPDTGVHL